MGTIDLEALLQPISEDRPCGESLEYTAAFGELERATQRKPEQQYGDTLIPAEEPSWGEVKRLATGLLGKTKDLRAVVYLARASLRTDGLVAFAESLALLRGMLERYWDGVHPQLDPEDDDDPTLRLNTVASLCDPETVLRAVREAPLVNSRSLGRYSLREVQWASGALAAAGVPPPDLGAVDAAFLGCDLEGLQGTETALRQALTSLSAIETLLTQRVGVARAVDLSPLAEVLRTAHQVLDERLARRGVAATGEGPGPAAAPVGAGSAAPGAWANPEPRPVLGELRSREDAVRLLDQVCDYFRQYEPSSPVPLLLERAKRLVSKSFLEIMRDLAPDGVSQVETLRGPEGGG